ncbi:uncharacterized protein LOC119776295 [Cyprinodon tularosa]|uniref:uncharacterized protein LOC119776295 n=1 Tax=Cyprinodon tularosa TaxID=77115 RepID=UPI0018E1F24C|nr:uncharacterized protein LOC119776295 [Cyprinodon tularosa]
MKDSAQGPAQVRSSSSLNAPDSDCPTEKPASTSHPPQMAIQHRLSKSLSQLSELLHRIKVDCGPEEKEQQEKGAEGESAGEEPQKWLHDLQQRGYPQKWLHDLQQRGYPQKWLHELEQYHLLKKALKNPKANGNQPEVPISPQLHATQGHQSQWHLSHPFPLHHEPPSQGIPSRDHLFYGSPLEKPWPKVSPEPKHYYFNPSFPMVPQLAQGFRPQLPVKPQQEHGFGFHPQREYGFQPMEPQYRNSLTVPVKPHDHGYGPISPMEPELPHEHIYRPTLPLEPQMPKRQPQSYQGHRAARLLARWPNFLPQRPNYVVLAPGHTNRPNYKARQGVLPQRVYHVPA